MLIRESSVSMIFKANSDKSNGDFAFGAAFHPKAAARPE
jgi:hypothetical protein